MTPTINDILSDMELSDLRHRYRNDPDVSRIIACLIYHRDKPDESEQEMDDIQQMCGQLKMRLSAWLAYHDSHPIVPIILAERTRELLSKENTP
jgi:hypothetical protein